MKRFLTYRHVVAIVFLIAAAAFGASIGTEAVDGFHLGLLAVGFPNLSRNEACGLCTPAREQASEALIRVKTNVAAKVKEDAEQATARSVNRVPGTRASALSRVVKELLGRSTS